MDQAYYEQVARHQEFEESMNVFQCRLREVLNYDPLSGVFTWKPRHGCRVHHPLGTNNGNGYLRITVDGKSHYAHRLAYVYVYGDITDAHIDHINGDRSDNRIGNLRCVNATQNQMNRHGPQSNNRSGLLGVSWHKKANKWQAFLSTKYLGLFETRQEAEQAYLFAKGIS